MKYTPNLFITLVSSAFISSYATAATSWLPGDDNISGGNPTSVSTAGFTLNVSETTQPETGDGFSMQVTPVGGSVNMSVAGRNSNPRAAFTFTIPAAETMISSIGIVVDFDLNVFPLNPDGSAGGVQALASIRSVSGDAISGDLTFGDLLVTPLNPRIRTTGAGATGGDNGGANFTLTSMTIGSSQYRSEVLTLVEDSSDPQFGEFTLNITPDGGGNFTPGTQFVVTFDAGYTVRTVPEPTAFSFLLVCSIGLLRKKRR